MKQLSRWSFFLRKEEGTKEFFRPLLSLSSLLVSEKGKKEVLRADDNNGGRRRIKERAKMRRDIASSNNEYGKERRKEMRCTRTRL